MEVLSLLAGVAIVFRILAIVSEDSIASNLSIYFDQTNKILAEVVGNQKQEKRNVCLEKKKKEKALGFIFIKYLHALM